jgi:bacillaene synthase trans-acting acyltransferase
MSKKRVFMFSGQGSQYYQMGKELYQNNETFKYWMGVCNEIVSPLINTSLIDIIYHRGSKADPFNRLLYTNPALLSIQFSMARTLNDSGVHPDYLLGYSLGEIIASVVSGVVTLDDGLELVVQIARFAEEKTPDTRMLAIMEDKMIVANDPDLFSKCWITATNFTGNFVVCGLRQDIDLLQQTLKSKEIMTQQLPVIQGFHTPMLESFENEFKQYIKELNLSTGKIPIISSYKTDLVSDFRDDYFWEIIRFPVNFQRTVENIVEKEDAVFIDVGPSGSLATSVKYILSSKSASIPLQTMNQYGRDLIMLEKFQTNLSVAG